MGKTVAIVLAGGRGKRMGSDRPKQYLELNGKPILYYTLRAFEESYVDEVILVTPQGDGEDGISYARDEVVNKWGLLKVRTIVCGGKERYHSVYAGLKAASESGGAEFVLIHDGARPFVSQEIFERIRLSLESGQKACVAAVPVTDTIKVVNDEGIVVDTPNRSTLWSMQTPQAFTFDLVWQAYSELIVKENALLEKGVQITDDAMVVEQFTQVPVRVVEGSYENFKVTTPEDLERARLKK